LVVLDFV